MAPLPQRRPLPRQRPVAVVGSVAAVGKREGAAVAHQLAQKAAHDFPDASHLERSHPSTGEEDEAGPALNLKFDLNEARSRMG